MSYVHAKTSASGSRCQYFFSKKKKVPRTRKMIAKGGAFVMFIR